MPRLRMVRSPMAPADYADHIGHWSVGTVHDCAAEDAARKLADFPGCFEQVTPPQPIPGHLTVDVSAPERHTATVAAPVTRARLSRK